MKPKLERRQFLQKSALAFGAAGAFGNSLLHVNAPQPHVEEPSWVELNGKTYGAKPGHLGPIGGGKEYTEIRTGGTYEADSFETLVDALSKARSGETVFIKGETEIDLTADIYIHDFFLEIPAGVTLAGNRGYNGSAGPILTSDALKTPLMIKPLGPGVRITGIRLKGPNPKRYMRHHGRAFGAEKLGSPYYYKFPTSSGIRCEYDDLEVDNCEIYAFGHSGISLRTGTGHRIHHNFIHHCQYHGLGYGISHDKSSSVIEFNLFDSNRHSIAGTGSAESRYIARHNIEMGTASSHCFDMHGGRDRKDGTNIAGGRIEIYNNTFKVPGQRAVVVRGEPVDTCEVFQNWFFHHLQPSDAVRGEARTQTFDNIYGTTEKKLI